MEQTCANCRYIDLEYDDLPCSDCYHCSSRNHNKPSYWAPQLEDLVDPCEKLNAISEDLNYIRLELRRIVRTFDKLSALAEGERSNK